MLRNLVHSAFEGLTEETTLQDRLTGSRWIHFSWDEKDFFICTGSHPVPAEVFPIGTVHVCRECSHYVMLRSTVWNVLVREYCVHGITQRNNVPIRPPENIGCVIVERPSDAITAALAVKKPYGALQRALQRSPTEF